MPFPLVITIILFFVSFLLPKNKILFFVQIVWIALLAGLNTNAADFQNNYETYYFANTNGDPYNLYNWLAMTFKFHFVNYVYFNFFLVIISTILIAIFILRLSKFPNLVISLFYIFPFVDNVIQKRWYYAMGILTIGLFLLLKEKKWGYLLYFLVVWIASQFHSGALLLYTLPIFMLIPFKWEKRIAIGSIIFGIIINKYLAQIVTLILPSYLQEKNQLYFSTLASSSSVAHTILWTLWQSLFILIVFYAYKNKKSTSTFDDAVLRMNLWSAVLVLFYAYDPVFARLFRPILILDYIYVTNELFFNISWNIRKAAFINFSMLSMSILSFVLFDIMSVWGFNYIVMQIFENNLLFQ